MKTQITALPISVLVLNEDPVTCLPTTTIREAARLMADRSVGSIVVMEGDRPVGIFTERDFLKKIAPLDQDIRNEPISKFMTPNPKSLPIDAPISKAMILMRLGRFRHILLQKKDGQFVGVLSIKDVLNYICDSLSDGESGAIGR